MKNVLILAVHAYFLEKENSWLKENSEKFILASKTQSFFKENILCLEKGQKVSLAQLAQKLEAMGYEKVFNVEQMGEFSIKGGILEVFPINQNESLKIEFLGNKIEKILATPKKVEDEKKAKEILKKKLQTQRIYSNLNSLREGDYVVHLDHGIGKFLGIEKLKILPFKKFQKFYVLQYALGDRLYVPLGLEKKLSIYFGFQEPKLSRLGTQTWSKTKKKVKKDAEKLAQELLEIYAKREVAKRKPYLPQDEWDEMLAQSFPYDLTPDQQRAIFQINKDLEEEKPMDRILVGDVGFGKTEVALRAAFKVVKSGFQVAFLCPTTILANQHFINFKERLKDFPVKVELLSRLQTKKEQKDILKRLEEGKIDIVIGTHRILSDDVKFKNLGFLIVDDEHKFGVKQKEKLKKLKESLDVLTMSATPIPRTLYFALGSLKEISLIQTPPEGRLPVKTFILPFKAKIIKKAILKEIERAGQVYYLHNRIETINQCQKFLENLISDFKIPVRLGILHGKMKEEELVKTMTQFQNKKINVLIATTIIEAGLDFPNVNTLIVADGTKLGLSQAYQIRGRIGRSFVQAWAYFLYPQNLKGKAKTRLKILKEADKLGCSYDIALRDLEMRGAGNILGKEQWGNVNKVGLNLYCQMLALAVEKLKLGNF